MLFIDMIFIYITGNCRFVNHEKSKKHKENVVFLREEMTADNEGIDGNELLGDDNISDEEEEENTSSIK